MNYRWRYVLHDEWQHACKPKWMRHESMVLNILAGAKVAGLAILEIHWEPSK
jgi:hypothetical protein